MSESAVQWFALCSEGLYYMMRCVCNQVLEGLQHVRAYTVVGMCLISYQTTLPDLLVLLPQTKPQTLPKLSPLVARAKISSPICWVYYICLAGVIAPIPIALIILTETFVEGCCIYLNFQQQLSFSFPFQNSYITAPCGDHCPK